MGQRVLVTAGASGIGREIVHAFLTGGARVYTCDINAAALEETRSQMPDLMTGLCDVGERTQVDRMVAEAADQLGGIDVLVNNAGVSGPTKPVHEIDPDDWEAVLRIDLTGPFNVTRNAIPHLICAGEGAIINMSSAAGRFGYPNRAPYAAAKWGLIGLTKTLSMELGEHNIRVNAIAPGGVDGERVERTLQARAEATGQSLDEVKRAALGNQSIKRFADPRDVAALTVFLASSAARSISGQVLPIDGDQQRN